MQFFHQEGELLVLGLVGCTKPCQFSMDGIDGGAVNEAVSNAGITEGRLVVLIFEEFLGEELLAFKPSSGCVRGIVGFPVIASIIHVW